MNYTEDERARFHGEQAIGSIAAALETLDDAICALRSLPMYGEKVADSISAGRLVADDKEWVSTLQTKAAKQVFELALVTRTLKLFATAQLDLPAALRASLELVQGQGVA